MSDLSKTDLIEVLQVNAEVRNDPNRPTFAREIQAFDEIDCEIALYEADHLVDEYMEQYRARFSNPEMFEEFVKVYRGKFREDIKEFISTAREALKAAGHGPKDTTSWGWGDDGYHKEDDDGGV
jgi:hypothetical protein